MTMSWLDLAFLHWRFPPQVVRPHLPAGLELDCFDGSAWVGVVPFRMARVGPRGFDRVPGVSRFAELNVRTYARAGRYRGVWFFSLDAESRLAVTGARALFHLPYFHARMTCEARGPEIVYTSERRDRRGAPCRFRARYRPVQPVDPAARSALELWLTERYCLFAADRHGRVHVGEVHHPRWPLERGEAEVIVNSTLEAAGLPAPADPPLVHFARELDVLAWPLAPMPARA
jgi:uncharacterized protein YqjF (DUF2071 family)